MSKSRRLLEALDLVRRRKSITAPELARDLGVSRRTALRYLQELSELGIPLASGPGPHGGYTLIRDNTLPPVTFSVDEAVALFFAYRSLTSYRDLPFEADAGKALEKLYDELPAGARRRVDGLRDRFAFQVEDRHLPLPCLAPLLLAAVEGAVLRIDYRSSRGVEPRHIQPVGVYAQNGFWYCPAYSFERDAMRLFRVDRVLDATRSDSPAPRTDIRALTLDSYYQEFVHPRAQFVHLHVRLTAEGIRLLGWREGLQVAEDGMGEIHTRIEAEDVPFFARQFALLAGDAVVVEPESMRRDIADLARRLLAAYGEASSPPPARMARSRNQSATASRTSRRTR